MKVTRKGDRYFIRYTPRGATSPIREWFETEAFAKARIAEIEYKRKVSRADGGEKAALLTIAAAFDLYRADQILYEKWSVRSQREIPQNLNKWFFKYVGAYSFGEFDRRDAQDWITSIIEDGATPAVVTKVVGHVGGLFKWGVEEQMFDDTPIRLLRLPTYNEPLRKAALDPEDVFLMSFKCPGMDVRLALYLLAFQGLRIGELCNLTGADLWVSGKPARELSVRRSKTSAGLRNLYVLPALTEEIKRWHKSYPSRPLDRPLLLTPEGHDMNRQAFLKQHFRPAAAMCGISPDYTTHDLRDTCATLHLTAGLPERQVADIVGHGPDLSTLRKRYSSTFQKRIHEPITPVAVQLKRDRAAAMRKHTRGKRTSVKQ